MDERKRERERKRKRKKDWLLMNSDEPG